MLATHHHEETVGVDRADKSGDDEAVPALVRFVHQRVGCVREQQRNSDHAHVPESDPVVFVGLLLSLGKLVLVFEHDNVG